ncbi:MAG TPA: cytochrome c [Burkholderiales bacterium]|nr:cytochrome c [Burkholderiales bacterium]
MKKLILILACVTCAWGGSVLAGDYEAGKEKAAACVACHGPDGVKPITPDIPRIGGQYYDYLVHSLKAYRSGARDNAMMSPMAKPLTDKEIKDVAWYFSRQTGLVSKY